MESKNTLPNLWHVFNLRDSPYFQETLGSTEHAYPLDLFIGREKEETHLLTTIGSSKSSRQAIGGTPGIGKTTLVQSVKAKAIDAGYWAADGLIALYGNDTVESVLGRLLSALYDTILSARPMIGENHAMQSAQQLVRVSRLMSGGANINIPGLGGAGFSKSTTVMTPGDGILLDGPRIMRDLLDLVRSGEGSGVILHLDNLENLTEKEVDSAADILRSLRDQVLMLEGLHILLVGTTPAVQAATGMHTQVRSVFRAPLVLEPLPVDDVQALLATRYRYLALDGRIPIPPISPDTIAALYPLFQGDLRSLISALEDGARLLVGVAPMGEPISLDDLRPALRQWYRQLLQQRLEGKRQEQLEAWGDSDPANPQTQKTLKDLWGVSQGAVSMALSDLEGQGYVLPMPRDGKAPIQYVLSGVSHLIFG